MFGHFDLVDWIWNTNEYQQTKPNHSDFLNTTETAQAAVKSIWLPSVGTLQLSESSILKRRESRKRRKRMASKGPTSMTASAASVASAASITTTNSISCDAKKENNLACTIRHRGCNVDLETIAWIESGLNRLANDSELMTNVLLKWNTFLKQHVMQNLSQVSFHEFFFQ